MYTSRIFTLFLIMVFSFITFPNHAAVNNHLDKIETVTSPKKKSKKKTKKKQRKTKVNLSELEEVEKEAKYALIISTLSLVSLPLVPLSLGLSVWGLLISIRARRKAKKLGAGKKTKRRALLGIIFSCLTIAFFVASLIAIVYILQLPQ